MLSDPPRKLPSSSSTASPESTPMPTLERGIGVQDRPLADPSLEIDSGANRLPRRREDRERLVAA